jgi:hypothetical protein
MPCHCANGWVFESNPLPPCDPKTATTDVATPCWNPWCPFGRRNLAMDLRTKTDRTLGDEARNRVH